jgi:hypothetical protein
MGVIEWDNDLRPKVVPHTKVKTLNAELNANVAAGSVALTDEHWGYLGSGISSTTTGEPLHWRIRPGSLHPYERHGENAWSLFKWKVYGIHHCVSGERLDRYLAEFTFRHNRRTMGEGSQVNALLDQVEGRLTYKALIA